MPEEVKSGELILSEQEKQQRIDELRRLIEGKVFVQRKETSSTFDTYIEAVKSRLNRILRIEFEFTN